jgi:hypothetical protein
MNSKHSRAIREQKLADLERHREEVEWTLNAIVGAIVTDRLPPDDAFAWARIAAREVARPAAVALTAA